MNISLDIGDARSKDAPIVAARKASRSGTVNQPPLEPGQLFQGYLIQGILGTGATGTVYRAYDEALDRMVALKTIFNSVGTSYRKRAAAEAKILARIRHPNVVPVYAGGVTDDLALVYIVMELVDGFVFRQVLRHLSPLTLPEGLNIGIQLCDGIEAAHRLDIVHRDLKPENIIVEPGNHLKIVDFGIAKFIDAPPDTITGKFHLKGTPLYMSPEQCRGENASIQSDIYAIGLTLFEAFLGTHFIFLKNPSPVARDMYMAHMAQPVDPLDKLIPGFPRGVSEIVARAIAKDPRDRWESARALGNALREADAILSDQRRQRRWAPSARDLVTLTRERMAELARHLPPSPDADGVHSVATLEPCSQVFAASTREALDAALALEGERSDDCDASEQRLVRERRTVPRAPLSLRRLLTADPPAARAPVERGTVRASPTPRGVVIGLGLHRLNQRVERASLPALIGAALLCGCVLAIPLGVYAGKARALERKSNHLEPQRVSATFAPSSPVVAVHQAPSPTEAKGLPKVIPQVPAAPVTFQKEHPPKPRAPVAPTPAQRPSVGSVASVASAASAIPNVTKLPSAGLDKPARTTTSGATRAPKVASRAVASRAAPSATARPTPEHTSWFPPE